MHQCINIQLQLQSDSDHPLLLTFICKCKKKRVVLIRLLQWMPLLKYWSTILQFCFPFLLDMQINFTRYLVFFSELQLKLEHKPVEHMNNWRRRIVSMLTGATDTSKENPTLKWRRNAKVGVVSEEREVTHPLAIRTLFYEAKHNYVNSLYPCKDHDVHTFASILILLEQKGKYDPASAKSFLHPQ